MASVIPDKKTGKENRKSLEVDKPRAKDKLRPAKECLREALEDARKGRRKPVSKLWDNIDAE